METSLNTNTDHALMLPKSNRKVDIALLMLLTILVIANAYLAHHASINHAAFDAPSKQIAFIVATTLGLPLVCFLTSLCFSSMRKLSSQLKMFTLTSAIVFVSNMPLLALIF